MKQQMVHIKDIYEYEVQAFAFLEGMGFRKVTSLPIPDGFHEVAYISNLFSYLIGMHEGRDENFCRFERVDVELDVVYPKSALNFFLENYDLEIAEIEKFVEETDSMKRSTKIEVELYKRHPWILTTSAWADRNDLINAISEANRWFYAQPDIKKAVSEYGNELRRYRTEDTQKFVESIE